MEKAKYGKMRQVNAVNGSQMVVELRGSYYRRVKGYPGKSAKQGPVIFHLGLDHQSDTYKKANTKRDPSCACLKCEIDNPRETSPNTNQEKPDPHKACISRHIRFTNIFIMIVMDESDHLLFPKQQTQHNA